MNNIHTITHNSSSHPKRLRITQKQSTIPTSPLTSDYQSMKSEKCLSEKNSESSEPKSTMDLNDIPVAIVIKSRLDRLAFEKTKYSLDEIEKNEKVLSLYLHQNANRSGEKA